MLYICNTPAGQTREWPGLQRLYSATIMHNIPHSLLRSHKQHGR